MIVEVVKQDESVFIRILVFNVFFLYWLGITALHFLQYLILIDI